MLKKVFFFTLSLAVMLVPMLLVGSADAAAFTFTTPNHPLQTIPGDGLVGRIWSQAGALAGVDTLAAARTFTTSTQPIADATFIATDVDYPNGSEGSTPTGTSISSALGVDAASLTSGAANAADVGANDVLNTIFALKGFLSVDTPGSLFLSIPSDDGSELIIQGTQVINNDGIHGFSSPTVEIGFDAAGLYAMDILFFESQVFDWGLEFRSGGSVINGTDGFGVDLYHTFGHPVPAPSTALLMCSWVIGLLGWRARKQRQTN